MTDSDSLVYSVDDVAKILCCEPATVATHLSTGYLPGLKFGRSWVIPVGAFVQRINELAMSQAAEQRAIRGRPHVANPIAPKTKSRRRVPPVLPSL
ncbi:MAG: helix-turn-helix domain-containing protein [Burkholderiaceae bacterium]|nr:helix-turn-helix domain-containing protein [Burkholderiaceae bacterium]